MIHSYNGGSMKQSFAMWSPSLRTAHPNYGALSHE